MAAPSGGRCDGQVQAQGTFKAPGKGRQPQRGERCVHWYELRVGGGSGGPEAVLCQARVPPGSSNFQRKWRRP